MAPQRVRLSRAYVPAFSQMATTAIVLALPVCVFIVASRTGALRLFLQALSLTKDAGPEAAELEEPDKRWMLLGQFNLAEAPWIFGFRFFPGLLLSHAITSTGLSHYANPPVVVNIPTAPTSSSAGAGAFGGIRVLLCGDVVTGRSLPQLVRVFTDLISWSVAEALLYASSRALGPGLFQDMALLHWLLVTLHRARRGDGLLRRFQRHARVLASYLAVVVLRNVTILVATAVVGGLLLPFVDAVVVPPLHRNGWCPDYLIEPVAQHAPQHASQQPAVGVTQVPTAPPQGGSELEPAICESDHMHEPSAVRSEGAPGPSNAGVGVGAAAAAADDGNGDGAPVNSAGGKCHAE